MLVEGNASVGMIKKLSSRHTGQEMRAVILSRRPARIATRSVAGGDLRTQPGVLTPGKGSSGFSSMMKDVGFFSFNS